MKVWRYPLTSANHEPSEFTIEMPEGASLRGVHVAGDGTPSLYAEGDPDATAERRWFALVPTGADIPRGAAYVGTFGCDTNWGRLVFHVYERDSPAP